jgi:hypothetical protein
VEKEESFMSRLDEHENNSSADEPSEPTREALERRIRLLEEENRRLQSDLEASRREGEIARDALEWYDCLGLPLSEQEMLETMKTGGRSISDVLAECEREFGK